MTTASLEEPTAILYQGSTATWCKGVCGKFRYPYCHVNEKPYCGDCAAIAQLRPVSLSPSPLSLSPSPLSPPSSLSSSPQKLPRPKRRLCTNPRKPIFPDLKEKILQALEKGPASSVELTERIGCHHGSLVRRARQLTEQGIICDKLNHRSKIALWYSLPRDKENLLRSSRKSTSELILAELKTGPKSSPKVAAAIGLTNSVTRKSLEKLVCKNTVLMKQDSGFKFYALPEHKQALAELKGNGLNCQIIELLRQTPLRPCQIANELECSETTIIRTLRPMMAAGQVRRFRETYIFYMLTGDSYG